MILRGKTVLVTGAGAGLGRECASAALREGANVVLAARNADALTVLAAELDPTGERVEACPADITDAAACARLVATATDRFGHLDALVQVAAFELAWGGVADFKHDEWRAAFETNVLGAMTVIREVAPVLKAAGGGSIVLIGSQAMFAASLPQAGYGASKGALLSTMYYLSDELGPDNIRCNMVVPSWMWGPPVQMLMEWRASKEGKPVTEAVADVAGSFPLRRMAEDGEVADVVCFFASDLAKAVTGQHLLVNCGELSR